MSKGFLVLAQNNSEVDYIRQAYALALSVNATQPNTKISLVTDDLVPAEYVSAFDQIIPIPFGDHAKDSQWKIENRWKLYHATPYDETIVFDADMLVLKDLANCWKFAEGRDILFTSVVKDYRGNPVTDTTYRKMFVENDLPNLYSGMYYFRKSDFSKQFFSTLEYISYNWKRFFFEIAPKHSQGFFSIDVACAITAKLLGIEDQIVHTSSPFTFVHMKPALQSWSPVPLSCYSQVSVNLNSKKNLYIGNYLQQEVFHYVEPEFLTNAMLENLRV